MVCMCIWAMTKHIADLRVHSSCMHPVWNRACAASAAGAPEGVARASASAGHSQVESLQTALQEEDAALAAERLAHSADVTALRSDLAEALKYREEYHRLERKCSGLRRRLQQQHPGHTVPGVMGQGSPAEAALQQSGHGSQASTGEYRCRGLYQLLCVRSRATLRHACALLLFQLRMQVASGVAPALRNVQVSWQLSLQPGRRKWRS